MGAMHPMDLRGLNLNYGTKAAIRSLGYGASCKIGIRFRNMWWRSGQLPSGTKISGGVGYTDLPIRVCVYPSYNVDDKPEKGGVLLCSHTWSQDAQRIGPWIDPDFPMNEGPLKEMLFHNLALLHSSNDKDDAAVRKLITESYNTHYSCDWYGDEHTAGAFAYFGPGQFQNMYPRINETTGKHIIIGEAASAHHAWIVGALESAVRGVYQFLYAHSSNPYCKEAMEMNEEKSEKKVAAPFGPLPAEYTPTQERQGPGDGREQGRDGE